MFGKLARTVPCPMCHGTQKHLCNTCLGAGFVSAEAWERTIVNGALALLALSEQVDRSNASRRSPAPTSPSARRHSRQASHARYSGNRTRQDNALNAAD
jgi:hypothetical protein